MYITNCLPKYISYYIIEHIIKDTFSNVFIKLSKRDLKCPTGLQMVKFTSLMY